ncbi:MAG: hypothetical protein PHX70_05720 [Clostridium sp.]|nr:hypothetical protein [Clostridium sp.]
MKFLRWISSLSLLILLILLIFKAGLNLINIYLALASVIFVIDIFFKYRFTN